MKTTNGIYPLLIKLTIKLFLSHLLFTKPARKTQRIKTKRKEKRTKKRIKRGGAAASTERRILNRGPPTQDKITEGLSMVLSGPTPNFGT